MVQDESYRWVLPYSYGVKISTFCLFRTLLPFS
jgi:hypothetical protein